MERATKIKILVVVLLVMVSVVFLHWTNSIGMSIKNLERWREKLLVNVMEESTEASRHSTSNEALYKVLKQRNELSVLLNEMRMKVGQMQCELSNQRTNDQGGWCRTASTEKGGSHMTDKQLIPVLSDFLKGKKVASFGDGPGAYKREILKLGEVAGYDAYDGAPYCEQTSEGRVKFLDLSVPQYGLPAYDWIMSLEVAEHIPAKYEAVYLDNIFRHAKEGIILSWAVPGQGGLEHINNRPLSYVISVMKKNGFEIDLQKSQVLKDGATFGWLKRNTHVYVRTQIAKLEQSLYV